MLKKYDKVYEYINLNDLDFSGYDLILSDIGDENHNVKVYSALRNLVRCENKTVIVKSFLEHYEDCVKFCRNFKNVTIIKPAYSFSLNREIYMICRDFSININNDDYVKAAFYSIFKTVVRAHEVYAKNIFVKLPIKGVEDYDVVDRIKVQQSDVEDYINDMVSSLNKENNNKINDFIGDVVLKISNVKIGFDYVDVNICNGPPGSCKSVEILNKARSTDLIIVPTVVLRDKYESKLRFRNKKDKATVLTMHKIGRASCRERV